MCLALVGAGGMAVQSSKRRAATVGIAQLVEVAEAQADVHERAGRPDEAARVLDDALRAPWPKTADRDVAIALRSALLGRWARLRLDDPNLSDDERNRVRDRIVAHLDDASELHEDAFTARLLAILGEIYEAEGRDDEALAAYERALEINRTLLERLLEEGGDAP
ncbi:MAG: tetratricopeptide repeat protein [Deltaproteobacteria bacterium]|nr:MAG: tetratricopeptide repeat protein [Deltaproteobacteria bacterium]